MRKTSLAATLAVVVLGMTGCTGGTGKPNAAATPPAATIARSAVPSSSSAAPSESPPWSDEVMKLFLDSYDRENFSEFSDGTPHQKVRNWYVAKPGELTVEIANQDWSEARVRWLALDIYERTVEDVAQLNRVTVTTEDHLLMRTVTAGDY